MAGMDKEGKRVCGVVQCDVVQCGVVQCGVVRCGVVRCGAAGLTADIPSPWEVGVQGPLRQHLQQFHQGQSDGNSQCLNFVCSSS